MNTKEIFRGLLFVYQLGMVYFGLKNCVKSVKMV